MKIALAFLLAWLLATAACGGGRQTQSDSLSGNWQMTITNTQTGSVKSESGFLLQSGKVLTGGLALGGNTACPGVGPVQGEVTGSNVQMTVDQVGVTVNLTGTVASGGSQMSGNYSLFSAPCGLNQFGTFTANQVKTLTGSLDVTFASSVRAGLVTNLTGTVSQGPNNGESSATLAGSMNSSGGEPCLSSVNISGQISGTAVIFNLLAQDGTSLGQLVGTSALDASSITGTYDVFPQSTAGCEDSGTATVTVQPKSGA